MNKLQPKYLTINFNFEMTASVVTKSNEAFSVQGHFRTSNDLAGLIWETEDTHSHSALKYPTKPSFKDVALSYDYEVNGYTEPLDSGQASALTIEMNDVTIHLDFNNLYEGWSPYTFDASGEWIANPGWKKIDVTDIKTIMWIFTPIGYTGNGGTVQYLDDSYPFDMQFTNWNIKGDIFLGDVPVVPEADPIRMCDDYDDSFNLTPERMIDSYLQLGYQKIVNFYIGASHYYDKKIVDGKGILLEDKLFNTAFETWYQDYIQRLANNNIDIIHSISMENVDAPEDWWQRTYGGTPGTSGWTPTPHFLSFTNAGVQAFYQKLAVGLAELSTQAVVTPMVQLGEPWWWHQDEKVPCFYDDATKNLYLVETGQSMYEFHTVEEDIAGQEEMLTWLQHQIGKFT